MAVGGPDRMRLARVVKRERTQRGLSVRAAAREAGVDRGTWAAVEDGSRLPQDHKAALMEPVIGMGPGSFESLLAGGDPKPMQEPIPLTPLQQEALAKLDALMAKKVPYDDAIAQVTRGEPVATAA